MQAQWHSIPLVSVLVACGPQAVEPGASGGGSGAAEDSGTGTSTPEDAGTGADTSTTGAVGVCGDGVLDPFEACDDGNAVDADGCSHACESSGTRAWSVEVTPGQDALAVALEVHDGFAVLVVQRYEGLLPTGTTLQRVDALGQTVGEFVDDTGFADLDIARQPLAITADGDALLGYPSTDGRGLARVDLAQGVEWTQALDDGATSHGTSWFNDRVLMLRRDGDTGSHTLLEIPDAGGPSAAHAVPTEVGDRPIQGRRIFMRGQFMLLTTTDEGDVTLYAGVPPTAPTSWSVDRIGARAPGRVSAAGDAVGLWIWTSAERIRIDSLGHLDTAEPRIGTSELLATAADGVITGEGTSLFFMGTDEQERWRGTSDGTPRFAADDGVGGVYVLSDAEGGVGVVTLERWVL
jgi:cysteine-rich repeat protein